MLKLSRNGVRGIVFSNYGFRCVFQYSTSTTKVSSSSFMVDYLVHSLGFSKEDATITSSKFNRVNSSENPNSVVEFLKASGFDKSHIQNIVSSFPKILSYNVDKTLKPRLKAFQDLGLYGSDLAHVICLCPEVFRRSLNAHILPTIEALKSVFGENDDGNTSLLTALKTSRRMLAFGLPKQLPANVSLLQNYGLSRDKIKVLLLRQSKYFSFTSKWLQSVLIRVEEKLRIPRDSSMFFHGICAVASMSDETLELKMEIYKSFGWTEFDILALARKNPYALCISESKIKSRLEFFMRDIGYKPAEIARCGCIMSYSLEKRVIPRNEVLKVLKDNGLIKADYCLLSCLHKSEAEFLKRFVVPFKDQVLGLYDDYMNGVCSSLKAVK